MGKTRSFIQLAQVGKGQSSGGRDAENLDRGLRLVSEAMSHANLFYQNRRPHSHEQLLLRIPK